MPINPMIWAEPFHRAAREEIGIALTVTNPSAAIDALNRNRPPGFKDYTVARPADPNLIFIVKPGVTLEDPEIVRELFLGGSDLAQ